MTPQEALLKAVGIVGSQSRLAREIGGELHKRHGGRMKGWGYAIRGRARAGRPRRPRARVARQCRSAGAQPPDRKSVV